jgi:putative intracellular protease/amidase
MENLISMQTVRAITMTICAFLSMNKPSIAQQKSIINRGDEPQQKNMKKKVLFVVTSHGVKGSTGLPTGYHLAEVAHPWMVFKNAGYEIDFVSPKGGKAPVDGLNLNDATNKAFWEDEFYHSKIENTMKPSEVYSNSYAGIYYAGGHGTMWDYADNAELATIASKIYENGGAIGAVCHGPSGLLNIKLSNGKYLVDGKNVNAFSNEEEIAVKLEGVVPFMLETQLVERGAKFSKAGLWQEKVVVDGRLVTGQNPASAKKVGEELLKVLEELK